MSLSSRNIMKMNNSLGFKGDKNIKKKAMNKIFTTEQI